MKPFYSAQQDNLGDGAGQAMVAIMRGACAFGTFGTPSGRRAADVSPGAPRDAARTKQMEGRP